MSDDQFRELIAFLNEKFDHIDRCFDHVDRRFDQIIQRFDELLERMDRRCADLRVARTATGHLSRRLSPL